MTNRDTRPRTRSTISAGVSGAVGAVHGDSAFLPEMLKRRWRWALTVVGVLVLLAAVLAMVARLIYDNSAPDSFWRSFATVVLLNGMLVAILGALIATLLSAAAEARARREAEADVRLGLFRRLRDAHVRVVLIQQILRARRDPNTYHEQMQVLQQAVKEMEEIREEVSVSGLYEEEDLVMIVGGIDLLSQYLNRGVAEYVKWCHTVRPTKTPTRRPKGTHTWVARLVAEHDDADLLERYGYVDKRADVHRASRVPAELASDDHVPLPTGMPPQYENGLEQSKLMMRLYAYGASSEDTDEERQAICARVCARRKALAAGKPASASVPVSRTDPGAELDIPIASPGGRAQTR